MLESREQPKTLHMLILMCTYNLKLACILKLTHHLNSSGDELDAHHARMAAYCRRADHRALTALRLRQAHDFRADPGAEVLQAVSEAID